MLNGKILKELRESKGLTQAELAKIIGVSKVTIHYYETGKRVPNLIIIQKLSKEFAVLIDDLIIKDYK